MGNGIYNFVKEKFKKSIHAAGWDLIRYNVHTSEDVLINTILKHFNIETIIDVGANEGQYAQGVFSHGYKGKIFSFEPIPSVFKKLKKKASRNENWEVFQSGVGSRESEIMMNITKNLTSSSVLTVGELSLNAQPDTQITHQEKIEITTLDIFFSDEGKIRSNTLLKLDTQGYELEAMKGAQNLLNKIKLVQVEMSYAPVYEGGPLYRDITSFLESRGFSIYTILPGFRNPDTGRMLQADGIFIKENPDN